MLTIQCRSDGEIHARFHDGIEYAKSVVSISSKVCAYIVCQPPERSERIVAAFCKVQVPIRTQYRVVGNISQELQTSFKDTTSPLPIPRMSTDPTDVHGY